MRVFSMISVAIISSHLATIAIADVADDIAEASAEFDADFNAGDAARIAENFTEDAIAMSPGWQFVSGREDIEKMFGAFLKAGYESTTSKIEDIAVLSGDAAVEMLSDQTERTDGAGNVTREAFKNMRVWVRGDDGIWRVHRWGFNDLPN